MSSLWFLFFIPALIAIVWGLIILLRPRRSMTAQRLNAAAMLLGGVAIILYAQGFRPGEESLHWDDIAYFVIVLAVIPLYYLAVRHLTTLSGIRLRDYLIFVAPAVVVVLGAVSLYVFNYEHGYQFSRVFIAFYTIVILIWSYTEVRSYYRLLSEYYSTVENTSVEDVRMLTITALVIIPVAITIIAIAHYQKTVILTSVMIVLLSVILFVAGFFLYRIRYSAENLRRRLAEYDAMEKQIPPRPSMSAEGSYARCLQQLKQAIETDKVYLDPDVTLVSLAERIQTNRTYLSEVIHLTYGRSFSDYINHLRIEYAMQLMREKKQLGSPILVKEVAMASGYPISSSFYRAFERESGKTPSKWIKENL